MEGVISAVPTPIDPDNQPDRDRFLEQARWALDTGCDGLNVLGTTGEATSFDVAARSRIMAWAASGLPRERLMVGTGTPSLAETVRLTETADDLGFGVALVLPPFYFKPLSDAGLTEWYLALHRALGRRTIRIYFYNFPQMTGIVIPEAVIATLHQRHPDRFAGIKDSSGDLDYCARLVAGMPALRVFPSSETVLAGAHEAGFAGCISASVNLTAPLAGRMWREGEAGNPGLGTRIERLRGALTGPTLIPAVKHLVAVRTGDAAWNRVLPPFTPLDAAGQSALSPVAQELSAHWSA